MILNYNVSSVVGMLSFPNTRVISVLKGMVIGVCGAPSMSSAAVSGTVGHINNAACLMILKKE